MTINEDPKWAEVERRIREAISTLPEGVTVDCAHPWGGKIIDQRGVWRRIDGAGRVGILAALLLNTNAAGPDVCDAARALGITTTAVLALVGGVTGEHAAARFDEDAHEVGRRLRARFSAVGVRHVS